MLGREAVVLPGQLPVRAVAGGGAVRARALTGGRTVERLARLPVLAHVVWKY